MVLIAVCMLVVLCGCHAATKMTGPLPHIVLIVADDLGWNDVSFHGSDQILTPNIDALAYHGVILNSHYSQPLCTPSRSALLTGKYPIHNGMQHNVILESEPWGLPLSEKILPQHLKRLGYITHAVGKWHLGFFKEEYTPTFRGFWSHYGFWNGYQDYYSHNVQASNHIHIKASSTYSALTSQFVPIEGYDMRRNMSVDWSARGHYSTDLFSTEAERLIRDHDPQEPLFLYLAHLAPHAGNYDAPFQAPADTIRGLHHLEDLDRRLYAAMVCKLDESVGRVVEALRKSNMLDNSIIVFLSDNGAPTVGIHANKGSNYPLKGVKTTPWEGGIRTVAAVWSPALNRSSRVSNQLMHITDWLPTLYSAVGGDVSELGDIDGMDMWEAISKDNASPRQELLVNIDDYEALRLGEYKYISGSSLLGFLDDWFGDSGYSEHNQLYNATVITSSLAGQALNSSQHWPLDVSALRHAATVHCEMRNQHSSPCWPLITPCIFNVVSDPCETKNIYSRGLAMRFEQQLQRYRSTIVPRNNKPSDKRADPKLWNNTWSSWADNDLDL
uniref:Sulfatase N-terminal domain-containing protein n=1 Tax=Timema poppense TaxID=170557 RepID=A0A7R9CGG8_TIMPO|nr:unnamed protein product [Timema poppensis]